MKNVLVLNAGSSSLKFAMYSAEGALVDERPLVRGLFELSKNGTTFSFSRSGAPTEKQELSSVATHAQAVDVLMRTLDTNALTPHAVGHRVVHGGGVYAEPVVVDASHYAALEGFVPLAPLHQPHNLAPIFALMTDDVPQVACFDTGFHRTIPRVNHEYAIPSEWTAKGFRKYGFHGLSYEYIASVLPSIVGEKLAKGKVIVAHLGSGSSMCGMKDGKSVVSTLEFSTIGRLPMGTRPGAIDAVMALEMAREIGIDRTIALLHKECGLLALSERSNDVRDLEEAAAQGDERAAYALEFFAEQAAQEIGKLAVALRGLDVLVFTAGIGERGSVMRARICARLGSLSVALSRQANERGERDIGKVGAPVRVLVIPTNEELMIARHTARLLAT